MNNIVKKELVCGINAVSQIIHVRPKSVKTIFFHKSQSKRIRNIIEKKVPVVLGGNLVNTYKKTNEKLKVDLVSQNIEQVLIELNLKYNKNSLKII